MRTRSGILAASLVALGCAEPRSPTAPLSLQVGSPTPTGALSSPRRDHQAVLLNNGKVLIVAGTGVGASVAELYDPMTETFTSLGLTVFGHPQGASATELAGGRVLIVGGGNYGKSAEIFDPRTNTFSATMGSPNASREYHTATLLADGRVLLAGGQSVVEGGPQSHALAEIFDPANESFTPVGDLNDDRSGHAATLLSDGKVLVVGGTQTTTPGFGICLASAELFDPSTATFSPTGSMAEGRCALIFTGITLLRDGRVLVFGWSASAEVFDPATGAFSVTGPMATLHTAGSATRLRNGRVLVAGGFAGSSTTAAVELYDPKRGVFSPVAALTVPRQQHSATRLRDGRILIAGGFDFAVGADLSSAELYPRRP